MLISFPPSRRWITIAVFRLVSATSAASLVACVTVGSQVVPVGKDTYQISMTGVGFATQANTNIKALHTSMQNPRERNSDRLQ